MSNKLWSRWFLYLSIFWVAFFAWDVGRLITGVHVEWYMWLLDIIFVPLNIYTHKILKDEL